MKVSALISNTLSDISVSHVSCVPGFGGSQVYDAWNEIHNIKLPYSFHEEVAFAVSHGVALSGKRAAMLTKSHGLAKAANAVVDSLYAGINAGFVIFVFHDETGSHSDNILDSETLIRGLRIPYEKPSKKQLQQAIVNSFERSEKDKIPVALLLDAGIVDDDHEYIKMFLRFQQLTFTRNIIENLVVPVFAKYQYDVVNAKLAGQNWHNIRLPNIPEIPGGLPPNYAEIVKTYAPLFDVFKTHRGNIVFGDTGVSTLFALPPYNCVDVCTYMGGSIPMCVGAHHSGFKNSWAVTGDFSFIAAGNLGLIEAVKNDMPVKVLIINNEAAQTTGGQPIPKETLGKILKMHQENVLEIHDPYNTVEVNDILQKASLSGEMQIVVANFNDKK